MVTVKLGNTGIVANKNGFGALPIQRIDMDSAVKLIHMALDGGVNFFDTARAYSDSEQKLGAALKDVDRSTYYIATKTAAQTGEKVLEDLETSLRLLQTEYIDIYQLHCAPKCFRPGDEDGVYDAAVKAKKEGKIRPFSSQKEERFLSPSQKPSLFEVCGSFRTCGRVDCSNCPKLAGCFEVSTLYLDWRHRRDGTFFLHRAKRRANK